MRDKSKIARKNETVDDTPEQNTVALSPVEATELNKPPSPGKPAPLRKPARQKRRRKWLLPLITLLLVAGGAGVYFWLNSGKDNVDTTPQTTQATSRNPVSLTTSATGQVQARAELKLNFEVAGIITEIMAKPGDALKKGQPIARIDDRELQNALKVSETKLNASKLYLEKTRAGATPEEIQKAEEEVKQAQLRARATRNGNSLPAEIQNARSQLDAARARLEQTKQGGSPVEQTSAQASVSSAESSLSSSQAKLEQLLAGPSASELNSAELKITQSQAELERTKSSLYTQVVTAQVARDQALTALNRAQDKYSDIYNKNHETSGKLKSGVRDEDITREKEAKRDLDDAQGNYNKADIALNDAKVANDTGQRKAQASVDEAKNELAKLKSGPNPSDVANAKAGVEQAKAALDSAKASLAKLTPTNADITSAQASVDSASATLARVTTGGSESEIEIAESNIKIQQLALQSLLSGPKPTDIATRQVEVEVAQADWEKAQLQLEKAVLKAPFDGRLVSLNLIYGQGVTTSSEIGQLVDASELHVDMSIGESEIGKVKTGQAVTLAFDALPNASFTGKITFISSKAQVQSSVVSYLVTVTLDEPGRNSLQETYPEAYKKWQEGLTQGISLQPGSAPVGANEIIVSGGALPVLGGGGFCGYSQNIDTNSRPKVGMTTSVTLCLEVKSGTLSVPTRAIKTKFDKGQPISYVEVLDDKGVKLQKTITLGLRGDTSTEITGGELKEGDKIVLDSSPKGGSGLGIAGGGSVGAPVSIQFSN